MPPPDAVLEHYAAQQRQAEAAVILARRQWARLGATLDEWPTIVRQLVAIVAAAQLGAARAGAAYVPQALSQIGWDGPVAGAVRPQAWAGVASDGRGLDSLLYGAVVHVKDAYASGAGPAEALQVGREQLTGLVRTQVADAGRGAAGVAVTARPDVGYTRMVNPPCCQRCAVLAGRFYRWNAGFKRHPRCDCRHTPTTEPAAAGYISDVRPDQIKDLTEVQRRAIGDGADPTKVINAYRKGRRSADGMTTSEGKPRRGRRLTPEGIYRVSSSREEAIQRLIDNGYLQ